MVALSDIPANDRLVRVVAPHFVAGLVIKDGICVAAAPILKRSVGLEFHKLERYFEMKGWEYGRLK